MLLFGFGVFFLFLALVFLIVTVALDREGQISDGDLHSAKGIVAGYDRNQHSSWHTMLVRIPALGGNETYQCLSGRISPGDYPLNTEVEVYYVTKRKLGMDWTTAYLKENMPPENAAVARLFRILTLFGALFGAALCAIGAIQYF